MPISANSKPFDPGLIRWDRIWSKISAPRGMDGCWIWTGALIRGYGQAMQQHRNLRIHRLVYEKLVGPIPQGLEIDHLCRVTACCNPLHLEPVTHAENQRRRRIEGRTLLPGTARKSHCINGHLFDDDNTFINRRGYRECRTCDVERTRERRKSKFRT